jgi:uncharacterized protein YecA (UPF0149 family)
MKMCEMIYRIENEMEYISKKVGGVENMGASKSAVLKHLLKQVDVFKRLQKGQEKEAEAMVNSLQSQITNIKLMWDVK